MKRLILLAAVVVALLLSPAAVLAHPNHEHTEKKTVTMDEVAQLGQPRDADLRDYAFRKDGSVVIDGDVVYDCRSFAGEFAAGGVPAADADSDLEQAQSVLERCEEAGFLPSEDATSSASATTTATASSSSEVSVGGGEGDLPDSGGPSLPAFLGASSVLLVASGLLVRKVVR